MEKENNSIKTAAKELNLFKCPYIVEGDVWCDCKCENCKLYEKIVLEKRD